MTWRSRLIYRFVLVFSIVLNSACTEDPDFTYLARVETVPVHLNLTSILGEIPEKVEFIIEIDNSISMANVQSKVVSGATKLMDALDAKGISVTAYVVYSDDYLRHPDHPSWNASSSMPTYPAHDPIGNRQAFLNAIQILSGNSAEIYAKPTLVALSQDLIRLDPGPKVDRAIAFFADEAWQVGALDADGMLDNPNNFYGSNGRVRYTQNPTYIFESWAGQTFNYTIFRNLAPMVNAENGADFADKLVSQFARQLGKPVQTVGSELKVGVVSIQEIPTIQRLLGNEGHANETAHADAKGFKEMYDRLEDQYSDFNLFHADIDQPDYGEVFENFFQRINRLVQQYTVTFPQPADPSSIQVYFVAGTVREQFYSFSLSPDFLTLQLNPGAAQQLVQKIHNQLGYQAPVNAEVIWQPK